MDHPFIDASDLTDEELQDKIQQCQKLLYQETHWGHTNVVNSIRASLAVYEQEFQERMYMRRYDEMTAKNPDGTIEIGTIEGGVEDYDEEKQSKVEVKRHKDL